MFNLRGRVRIPALALSGIVWATAAAAMASNLPPPTEYPGSGVEDCLEQGTSCTGGRLPCCAGLTCTASGICALGCVERRTLYPAGAADPNNSCRVCIPAISITSLTTLSDGSACSDGDACSVADSCFSGVCVSGAPLTCSEVGPSDLSGPCDDCNLNGIGDACDPTTSSPTAFARGVPDACVDFTGGCGTPNWSCPQNWNLGGQYPNNAGVNTYNVNLTELFDDVFVDLDVQIDTLRVVEGSTLRVTQHGPDGDLQVVAPGGLLLQGSLDGSLQSLILVSNDRRIDVASDFRVGPGGLFSKLPGATGVTSVLSAGSVTIESGVCSCTPTLGGVVELAGGMRLEVAGDLVMVGSDVDFCTSSCAALRGGLAPPPKLGGDTGSSLQVGGNFTTTGRSGAKFGATTSPRGKGLATTTFELLGDFQLFNVNPALFSWAPEARLLLSGVGSQRVEAAGTDLGRQSIGFDTNFALGIVEVAAGRDVTFADDFNNNGVTGDEEAAYIHTLVLRAGSQITVDGCKVFYGALVNEGAAITLSNGGRFERVH